MRQVYSFDYRFKTDIPPCPACGVAVPTGADSPHAFRLEVRKGGVTHTCILRSCYCGQDLAIDQTRETLWGYSYRCKRCGSYEAALPYDARCTSCYMRDTMGLKDPLGLVAGVRESEPFITASREDMIDALMHGLLSGAPGLTVEDQAA